MHLRCVCVAIDHHTLQGDEQRIYEYVVRHFLACCSQNAEGQETSVEIEVAGEGFSAQGLIITARNYLDVFPYDKWSDKVCVGPKFGGGGGGGGGTGEEELE